MTRNRFRLEREATANDSSKPFVVPTNEIWVITHINVSTTATATVGNRRMRVTVDDDSSNQIAQVEAAGTFAASQTQVTEFFTGAPDATSEVNDTLKVAMPILILLPGYTLTVEDGAAVDAAADDMTVSFIKQVLSV